MQDSSQPLDTTFVAPSRWAAPAAYAPGPAGFSAGAVIGKALSAWWRNLLPFTLVSVVSLLPFSAAYLWLMQASLSAGGRGTLEELDPAKLGMGALALMLLSFVLFGVACGAITFGTFRFLRNERVGLGRMIAEGLRRFLPVTVAYLVAWLGISFGMLLLLAPGLMLASAWAAAIPACVVERSGPIACLGRSSELTRGHRMQVFLSVLAVMGVMWAASTAVQVVSTVIAVAAIRSEEALIWVFASSMLGNMLFGMLPTIGTAAAYHELRVAREGLDSGHLASVFD